MENTPITSPDSNEKVIAAVSYFIFFLPLITGPKNKFTMFHVNQAFNLFLFSVIVMVLGSVIPILGWFLIGPLGTVASLVFGIMGIINALNHEQKELPFIGKYKFVNFG